MRPTSLKGQSPSLSQVSLQLPLDPSLPNLRDAVEGLGPVLQRSLGVADVTTHPRYIRYKPGNKAIILHDVNLDGEPTWAVVTVASRKDLERASRTPEAAVIADRARPRALVGEPIAYLTDIGALIEWYPANLAMPGLSTPTDELHAGIAEFAGATGDKDEPTLIHYRPERRAVMRWGDVYLKAYAVDEHYERAILGLEFPLSVPGIVTPRIAKAMPQYRMAAQTAIPGGAPARDRESRIEMGQVLADLHQAPLGPLPELTPTGFLDAVKTTARQVTSLLPHLADEVATLLKALEVDVPNLKRPVVSHGDFHRRQAITIDGGLALIDFDSICIAHPAYDVAKFAASQINGRRGLDRAFEWLDDLVEGYGRRPADIEWHIAASVLRRSSKSFRFLHPDWPESIEAMVSQARAVLQGAG
jgi:aminoglycoside phosphotransferase (APT) family kinase protein